ncbi:MAG: DMT family transporter [Roseitalea sp.]|nr:DMT family transporter [Roseitalea sp.]MBO6722196.1 DMT family transporter [Roseitalea sp.]MBO6745013.1 DMT family transporter [Roseitalea sp.]
MVLAVGGALLLPAMDAVAKLLGQTGAMSPAQVTFFRFAIQAVFCLVWLLAAGGIVALRSNRFGINFVRGVLLGAASLFFFTALKYMPLADAIAVFFVEPLILTLLSFIVLREPAGWRRVAAVIVGFGGALVVIQPSYAVLGPVSLLPLGAATLFATYLILNRIAGRNDGAMVMQFVSGLGGMAIVAVAMAVGTVAGIDDLAVTPTADLTVWALVLLMGMIGLLGHHLFVRAFQMAPASLLAPLQYIEIISAALFGFLLFSEFPTPTKWLGIGIIIASGLYVFWRERAHDVKTNK